MPENSIDLKQALLLARPFNLAFNNAFMFGGEHQSTKDSAAGLFTTLGQMFGLVSMITVSVERGSIYIENHCVDKLVSVSRIVNRFVKAGVQSVSFDQDVTVEGIQSLFYMFGSLSDFKDVITMQECLRTRGIPGVRLNYVVYQKVTVDETIVNKDLLEDAQLLSGLQPNQYQAVSTVEDIRSELADIITLSSVVCDSSQSDDCAGAASEQSSPEYDSSVSSRISALRSRMGVADDGGETGLTATEMMESVYKLKEQILEQVKIHRETGVINATDELAVSEINQLSYQVIVRLIRDEYRNDRQISVKRLAQIIRRMLPDIKELKFLLPQLKDGLFAEGMPASDYLMLVKELSKELASDELMQVMVDASEQIGLTFHELIEGIKNAPEESARLIILASEIRNGGVQTDEHQLSVVLSEYIERVSRALAVQSAETVSPGGGGMLKAAVSRIEQELLERMKAQQISPELLNEVARNLVNQFSATVSNVKGDWVKRAMHNTEQPDEEVMLTIIEQVAEQEQHGYGVTDEVRHLLLARGYSAETLDTIIEKAYKRASSRTAHALELPAGVHNAGNTGFFLDREVKLQQRYNTTFSTLLISYERVVDPWTTAVLEVTPDITNQLTNQVLKLLKELLKRDTDIIGTLALHTSVLPLMIFPMTEQSGALYIQKRLQKSFATEKFLVNGIIVLVTPRITVLGCNKKIATDRDSYLKALYQQHFPQQAG